MWWQRPGPGRWHGCALDLPRRTVKPEPEGGTEQQQGAGGTMTASEINFNAYSDVLVLLGTAGLAVPLGRRLGIAPVLCWLLAGVVLGPMGLGALIDRVPLLYWVTVVDATSVDGIAQLGVVFLLFLIGLELSYERLRTMRRLVFGLGGLQVGLSALAIAAVLAAFGESPSDSAVLGACLALSSTAIVIEVLSDQGRVATQVGRASFAVLLAQDLAVVPVLLFISILAGGQGQGTILSSLALALANAGAAVVGIVLFGRLMFRPLFRLVAASGQRELFVATTLFVIIAAGVAAAAAGLSMALGAFVAGLLLAETEWRKAIEAAIGPFKGLLLGLFFMSVGMSIDPAEILRAPLALALGVAGLIGLKAAILMLLGRAFRLPWLAALEMGMLLGPGGEFAFVGIGLATAEGLIAPGLSTYVLTLTALTMALIPVLALAVRRLVTRLEDPRETDPELQVRPVAGKGHAIVVGYGRVGQVVCALLDQHGLPWLAVDNDPRSVPEARRSGREVYFGTALDVDFLAQCGLAEARALVITSAFGGELDEVIAQVRRLRPDLTIVARARSAVQARHLYGLGVSDAVPETIEASLQLSEATLLGMGLAAGRVIATIHDKRDVFRQELQAGLRDKGVTGSKTGTKAGTEAARAR